MVATPKKKTVKKRKAKNVRKVSRARSTKAAAEKRGKPGVKKVKKGGENGREKSGQAINSKIGEGDQGQGQQPRRYTKGSESRRNQTGNRRDIEGKRNNSRAR